MCDEIKTFFVLNDAEILYKIKKQMSGSVRMRNLPASIQDNASLVNLIVRQGYLNRNTIEV